MRWRATEGSKNGSRLILQNGFDEATGGRSRHAINLPKSASFGQLIAAYGRNFGRS
jgi:hypothetical protein